MQLKLYVLFFSLSLSILYKYRNNNYLKKVSTVYLVFFILKILVLNINYSNNNNNNKKERKKLQ